MKMVRSLLLGTAAGFVALSGAQAADLPVKAKPVQYVKICDLYGAGYFYVPGTDTCMKIGGYVRFSAYWNQSGASTYGFVGGLGAGAFNRLNSQDSTFRSRAYLSADVRSQTAWGTLRSYYAVQWQTQGPNDLHNATTTNLIRAFIQFAGFTLGRTTSLFDTPDALAFSSLGNPAFPGANGSGAVGINAVQYTAALGNGLSASVGLEGYALRDGPVVRLNGGTLYGAFVGATSNGIDAAHSNGSRLTPDITANIDLTQAWGSARLVGALHSVAGSYYNGSNLANGYAAPATCAPGNLITCGSPGDTLGYAIGAGFTVTAIPGLPGDLFGITATYARGASAYSTGLAAVGITDGSTSTVGSVTDGIYINGSGIELTEVWGIQGAFRHSWAPNLNSSIFAGYNEVRYSGTAKNWICNPAAGGGAAAGAPIGGAATITPAGMGGFAVTNCNPDFSYYAIGSRVFSWTPVQNLNLGLEVIYWNANSAHAGAAFVPAHGATAAGTRTLGSNEVWTVNFQVTRSFWP